MTKANPDPPKQPTEKVESISRREFLKTAGTTLLGAAAAGLPVLNKAPLSSVAGDAGTAELIDLALSLAEQSPIYQDIIREFEYLDVKFELNKGKVKFTSQKEDLFGLVLDSNFTKNKRQNANLILNLDISTKQLLTVEYIIGQCQIDHLSIRTVLYDSDLPPFPIYSSSYYHPVSDATKAGECGSCDEPVVYARQREERTFTFGRPGSPAIEASDFVEKGWPPEKPGRLFWYFDGCTELGSQETYHRPGILRAVQVSESPPVIRDTRNYRLEYPNIVLENDQLSKEFHDAIRND